MDRHWALQPLAFAALLLVLALLQTNVIFHEDFCRKASSPPALIKLATWAGVCFPECKTNIPTILTSWEIHALKSVATKLPDPNEMVKNRIGKTSKNMFIFSESNEY